MDLPCSSSSNSQNDALLNNSDTSSMIDLAAVVTQKRKNKKDNTVGSEAPIPEWSPSLSPEWKLVKNQWVAMKKWIHANPKQADRHLMELVLLIELMAEEKINPPQAKKPQSIKKKIWFVDSWIGYITFMILCIGLLAWIWYFSSVLSEIGLPKFPCHVINFRKNM